MKKILGMLGMVAVLVVVTAPADAANKAAKCDKVKATAVGKVFAKAMACLTKNFAKPDFDADACIAKVVDKCIAAFDKIDDKLFDDCRIVFNSDLCVDTEFAARGIYDDI